MSAQSIVLVPDDSSGNRDVIVRMMKTWHNVSGFAKADYLREWKDRGMLTEEDVTYVAAKVGATYGRERV